MSVSQGRHFYVEVGWKSSLAVQITLSPSWHSLSAVFTRATVSTQAQHADLSAGTRAAVTAGLPAAALFPPGRGWQPLITGVMWACQPDFTQRDRRALLYSLRKKEKKPTKELCTRNELYDWESKITFH